MADRSKRIAHTERLKYKALLRLRVDDAGAVNPRLGAAEMRKQAFMRWCPSCQNADHFNHEDREVTRGAKPEPGACYSTGGVVLPGEPCACLWRPPERPSPAWLEEAIVSGVLPPGSRGPLGGVTA